LSLGGIGASLEIKLLKPTKVASGAADELRIDQLLFPQTESQVRTAQAPVLGKADAAAGREVGGFNLPNGARDDRAKAVPMG